MKEFISWNVNGIRACHRKGFLDWFSSVKPDFLLLQEVKAEQTQLLEDFILPNEYKTYWFSAQKKGYSGVACFTKHTPIKVFHTDSLTFDMEGRVQILEYSNFYLFNCYFPNSQEKGKRLEYKISFCNKILELCSNLKNKEKNIIICGDFNIAHTEIDLKNPKNNTHNPGFLPEERKWMDDFLKKGYIDTFRFQHPNETNHYTWWSYRFQARQKNIGWRIDYFCINQELKNKIYQTKILNNVLGSDHCPIYLSLNL